MDHNSQSGGQNHTPLGADRELPGLSGIAGLIRWIEELIALLSGPLLTIGLAIALIDLLTGGDLLRSVPLLLFAWGACQAVGIDSQLVAIFDKLRQALRAGRWWAALGMLALGLMLGYVGFVSAEAFGFQHAFQVTEAQALARLGIDPISWQLQRAFLAVFLVALSGFNRYHPPAKNYGARATDEAERLKHEIELEPLRAQARAAKLRNAREAVKVALGREGQQAPQPVMLDVFTPGRNGHKPVAAAPVTLPLTEPQQHSITANKMMHDWDEYDDGILDEVSSEDAADALFGTQKFDEDELTGAVVATADTTTMPRRTRTPKNSGPTRSNARRSASMREFNRKLKSDAKATRRAAIRDAVYAILDEWHAAGEEESISDKELARRVAARVDFAVNPSGSTVGRWRGPWRSSRTHKAEVEREQQDTTPMVADDIVEMLETEHEEALV